MAAKKLKLWFDKALAQQLAAKITAVEKKFKSKSFVASVDTQIHELELKPRIEVFADELFIGLKSDYEYAIGTLMKILGPENEEETGMFSNFYWVMPIAKLIEKYGLEHFDLSMNAIEEITKRNTGEYAIRPYLLKYPKPTIKRMQIWAKDSNSHLRRLASEGGRPRLPWATKLEAFVTNPKPLLPILNKLKDDTSKYVQKSVANCLNDILKDNPEIAKAHVEKWNGKNISKERQWIIKHALRNLVKQQDEWAMGIVNS